MKIKKNNGITLIALVITIIVLLILAGVAIAMLSGENGILNKAKDAKEKTEKGQEQEETTLSDYALDMYFIENNKKYKCRYGMITGFSLDNERKVTDKVQDLKDALPQNESYEILQADGKTKLNNDQQIATGMIVKKEEESIATVVVFGDINGSGEVEIEDKMAVQNYIEKPNEYNFNIYSMDVNQDGFINIRDINIINDYISGQIKELKQNVYATNPAVVKQTTISDEDIIKSLNINQLEDYTKKSNEEWRRLL